MKKKTIKIGKYVFHTTENVFKKSLKSEVFQRAYKEEIERLHLVMQMREAREAKKMTQAMLAKKTNMSQSVIARMESGRKGLSLATLSRVAAALGKQLTLV